MLLRRVIEHVRTQNWFAVGLDFRVVVGGILVAFQITSCTDRRGGYRVRVTGEKKTWQMF
jgi:hypothetical protein